MRPSSVPPCVRSGHCNSSSMYRLVETFSTLQHIQYFMKSISNLLHILPRSRKQVNLGKIEIKTSLMILLQFAFLIVFFLNSYFEIVLLLRKYFHGQNQGAHILIEMTKLNHLKTAKNILWLVEFYRVIKRGEINIFW